MVYGRVKRALGRDTIVIVDGMNYIKGWRYQLWCEAKAVGTTCTVVRQDFRLFLGYSSNIWVASKEILPITMRGPTNFENEETDTTTGPYRYTCR